MNSHTKKPDFSYRDENALVRHLVDELEHKLAGRHESRILRIIPSDHCHLGVLGPRDHQIVQPEPLEVSDEMQQAGENTVQTTFPTARASHEADNEEGSEFVGNEAEQVSAEQQGSTRDSTRRPPSSLGFEIVLAPERKADIELALETRFCFYTQHLPTFEEQHSELGRIEREQVGPDSPSQQRQNVSLLEVFERREVTVPAITIRIDPNKSRQRLSDGGQVQHALDTALADAATSPTIGRSIVGKAVVSAQNLSDAGTFHNFLRNITAGPAVLPPLKAGLDIRASTLPDGTVRVSCYICNDTLRNTVQRYRDQYNILGDCELRATIFRGELMPVELLPVARDYQFDRRVWAVGHSASVVVSSDKKALRTQSLARFEQPRRTTNQNPRAPFTELAKRPLDILEQIRLTMISYGDTWQEQVLGDNSLGLSEEELHQCDMDLKAFRHEESRFAAGIAALNGDEKLLEAFKAMNRIFQRTSRFECWHLFQIVFIVTQLPALAIREGTSSGEWPVGVPRCWDDILDWADVLWFPTGGGKTEAYLGLISCAAIYDRLRGKNFGVTAWLRFPLRMLSVQQLQRAARIVWETEQERRALQRDASGSQPISLGYFVGRTSTPNRLNRGEWLFDRLENDSALRNKLLLVNDCPACKGIDTVQIVIDRNSYRIRHLCSRCHEELPVYVSDDEIYRFLPTVIVGTIDKMASIAYRADFPMLWGAAAWRCPEHFEHGFGMGDWCIPGCPTNPARGRKPRNRLALSPYDPSPAFHIQDELHLLQQELGAFAGHYETLVRSCEDHVGRLPPKTIAATATIEGFERQIRQIYGIANARRFPTRGYRLLESFYTAPDFEDDLPNLEVKTARVFVAFRPPHLHAADAASLCVRYLHEELIRLFQNPYDAAAFLPTARTEEAVRELLNFYSTTLTYVGSKSRGVRIRQALDRAAGQLRPGDCRDLNTEMLSGDSTLATIAEVVRRIEDPPDWSEESFLDSTIATSIISHGVDLERFNLMVMDSIPEEPADYIQASSRSGRRHVGLVLAALASYSLRASSIYHRFQEYHRHLDRLVSPVPVNRFAKFAAQRTSPGVFAGLLLGRYGAIFHNQQFAKRRIAAEFLNPSIQSQLPSQLARWEIEKAVREAYALDRKVYSKGLELRMGRLLSDQIDHFLHLIAGSRKERVTDVLQPTPMRSLRDVDAGVKFRPDEDVDYHDLQWFNMENS